MSCIFVQFSNLLYKKISKVPWELVPLEVISVTIEKLALKSIPLDSRIKQHLGPNIDMEEG